jgi:hypothetical protein
VDRSWDRSINNSDRVAIHHQELQGVINEKVR